MRNHAGMVSAGPPYAYSIPCCIDVRILVCTCLWGKFEGSLVSRVVCYYYDFDCVGELEVVWVLMRVWELLADFA